MDRIDILQMKTIDPQTDMLALTSVLHRVCDNDDSKFDEACRLIRLFMEAAQNDGK